MNQTTTPGSLPSARPTREDIMPASASSTARLMLSDEALSAMTTCSDETFAAFWRRVHDLAAAWRDEPLHSHDDNALFPVRRFLDRVYTLGLMHRSDGDPRWLDALWRDRAVAAQLSAEYPRHWLLQAERAHAESIFLDWVGAALPDDRREAVRTWLVEQYLPQALTQYEQRVPFLRANHNWNLVLNSSNVIAALAVRHSHPQYLERILPQARLFVPIALNEFCPDGAAPEGPEYWWYAMTYACYLFTALQSVYGHDHGLSAYPGLEHTGWYPIHNTGPTGLSFNYADSYEDATRRPMPCMFYLARRYAQPAFAGDEHAVLTREGHHPIGQHLVWYAPYKDAPTPPRHRVCKGKAQLAHLRSDWDDPDAVYVAARAGYNWINHAHQDLGGFVLDARGVRWFVDLGLDDYALPGYFGWRDGEQRWRYFRCAAASHNVPLIGDQQQAVQDVNTRVTAFESDAANPFVVFDLTDAYRHSAERVARGIRLLDDGAGVLVQDEITLRRADTVCSNLMTAADIQIDGPRTARLSQSGQTLWAQIIAPDTAHWQVRSAEQSPPQAANKGYSRLIASATGERGATCTLALRFSPGAATPDATLPVATQALNEWSLTP